MALVLLLGGARSGKSSLAVALAAAQSLPVVFLATGEAGDEEMAERIAVHRRERPPEWRTVEEPLLLEQALTTVEPGSFLIVDCLSLWVANAVEAHSAAELLAESERAAAVAAARPAPTVAVTNEVGLGVVPATPPGRSYRDLLGRVNAVWADAAERAYFVVAGRTLELGRLDV